jgi:anti-sigma regulatory factor (Ser/Thr protein kinase)
VLGSSRFAGRVEERVDWYLESGAAQALRQLRREIRAFLARHAEPGTDTSDAELIVEELVGNALRHAGGGVWVQLTWTVDEPELIVSDLGSGFTMPRPPERGCLDLTGPRERRRTRAVPRHAPGA